MSEPKPLSKERRAEIRSSLCDHYGIFAHQYIEELFAAEQYWRSAVKNADVCGEIGVPCPWCGARSYDQNIEAPHRYGCEYLKAQE